MLDLVPALSSDMTKFWKDELESRLCDLDCVFVFCLFSAEFRFLCSLQAYKVSYLGVHLFILFHKSSYIFFAHSIVFLHGASFSLFFGLASSTLSLFVLFLIVFCLLCKPVDLDSLNFIWVYFSQCGYILGHLRGKYTRALPFNQSF